MKSAVNYQKLSDEDVFALVRQGDDEAFNVIYDRYDRRLFAYCLTAMKSREAAEDVYQSTMMSVFKNRDSFKGGNFAAWFFTIARNFCLKAKRNVLQTAPIDDYTESIADADDRTANDVLMKEAFDRALYDLPDEFREPIEMKYLGGFAYEEISRMLDISMSLVKVRIFRAKKMLKKSLQSYRETLQ